MTKLTDGNNFPLKNFPTAAKGTMGASKSPVHEEAAAAVMTSGIHGNHMEASNEKRREFRWRSYDLDLSPHPGCQDPSQMKVYKLRISRT